MRGGTGCRSSIRTTQAGGVQTVARRECAAISGATSFSRAGQFMLGLDAAGTYDAVQAGLDAVLARIAPQS